MKPHLLILSSTILILSLLEASQAQIAMGQTPASPPAASLESLVFTFKIPALQITSDGLYAQPTLEGFEASAAPGDPLLPVKVYHIALPPDVIPRSVTAQVLSAATAEQSGVYQIAPAPPAKTWANEQETTVWGKHAGSILDGKNTQVYQNDAFFPAAQLSEARFDQMRKWRFVSLRLTPLQYNPVAGKLRLATEVQVRISFERSASVDQRQLQLELSDTVMDQRAADLFYNYAQALAWYPALAKPAGLSTAYDYVIITTNFILANNTKLNAFKAHKEAPGQGHHVLIITENQYGGLTGEWPNRTAQKIRQWLKNNYLAMGIEYVLLIGDPTPYDPDNPTAPAGAVPMRMCWPWHFFVDPDSIFLEQTKIPTDYLYADLTGNWDLNSQGFADEYCGEEADDDGPGGMSFSPEVYVGRIPIYYSNFMWSVILDYILDKTILYEDSEDVAWRKRALLPMSFLDQNTDGATLAEAMKTGYLNANGYTSYTFYQHYSNGLPGLQDPCYSSFSSNQDLVDKAVWNNWKNNSYGIVTWWGHGDSTSAKIGYGTCGTGTVLNNVDAAKLDPTGTHPAIVFAASSENGKPEVHDNLGDMLLFKGAVATISASRLSFYDDYFGEQTVDADMAYYIMERVVNGASVGHALYDEIYQMSQQGSWAGHRVPNWITYNLYGDPSLSINDHHSDVPSAPSSLTATPVVGGIKLTWTDTSDNELGFVIERGFHPGGPWMQKYTPGVNATEQYDLNLSCGTHYYYRIQAYNAHTGSDYSSPADAVVLNLDEYESDNTYSDAKFIIASGSGANGQTHTFSAPGDVDWIKFNATWGKTYTISASNLGINNDTYLELYNTNGTQKLAENDDNIANWAAPATGVYYIKVSNAADEGGCEGYEYDLAVKEGGWADWPTQPIELIATPISHCQIDLTWVPSSFTEQGFEIERFGWKPYGGMGYGIYVWQKIATVAAGVTVYSDSGLECNKYYPYRVRAFNANGKSFYTTASATTLADDAYEPDDYYGDAKTIVANGTPQFHNFDVAYDQDWVKFSASAGQVYTITTSNLGSKIDTELELYDKNGVTLLASNDDCAGLESCIKKWAAPSSGNYYIHVKSFDKKGGCPGYQYTLTVVGTSNATSLGGPSGLYISDWGVSALHLTWPDTASTPHAFKIERWEVISGTLGQWRQLGIAGPSLAYRSASPGAGLARPDDGNTGFEDAGLTCNTTYDYRVRAFDALGDSPYSEVISATTLLTDTYEPDDVIGLASEILVNAAPQDRSLAPGLDYDWFYFTAQAGEVYTITTSQFTHSDSDSPAPNLSIYHGGGYLEINEHCENDPRALCINGWIAGENDIYYLLVRGQGGCPGHDYSVRVVNSRLSETLPAPPTVFTGTLTAPDTLDLTWTDPSNPQPQGYRLERQVGLGWLQIAKLSYNVTVYRDAGLACGHSFLYRVFAYNASGESSPVMAAFTTPVCSYPPMGYPLFLPHIRR